MVTRSIEFAIYSWIFFFYGFVTPSFAQVKILLPTETLTLEAERSFNRWVDHYNQNRPASAQVEILRKGSSYSSFAGLMGARLAGNLPDLAAIEISEFDALKALQIKIQNPNFKLYAKNLPAQVVNGSPALPFQRAFPVLVVDQEVLFRTHIKPEIPPRDWGALTRVLDQILNSDQNRELKGISFPLYGHRGLLVFEQLVGVPLWKREAGGIRANPEILPKITQLQKWLDVPRRTTDAHSWERAIQDFLDRKVAMIVTTSDALPEISRRAKFRWKADRLPSLGGQNEVVLSGSDWVILSEKKEIQDFLSALYTPEVRPIWGVKSGFLGETQPQNNSEYALPFNTPKKWRPMTHDISVIRNRTLFMEMLQSLFGDPSSKLSPEEALNRLDQNLNRNGSQ